MTGERPDGKGNRNYCLSLFHGLVLCFLRRNPGYGMKIPMMLCLMLTGIAEHLQTVVGHPSCRLPQMAGGGQIFAVPEISKVYGQFLSVKEMFASRQDQVWSKHLDFSLAFEPKFDLNFHYFHHVFTMKQVFTMSNGESCAGDPNSFQSLSVSTLPSRF